MQLKFEFEVCSWSMKFEVELWSLNLDIKFCRWRCEMIAAAKDSSVCFCCKPNWSMFELFTVPPFFLQELILNIDSLLNVWIFFDLTICNNPSYSMFFFIWQRRRFISSLKTFPYHRIFKCQYLTFIETILSKQILLKLFYHNRFCTIAYKLILCQLDIL